MIVFMDDMNMPKVDTYGTQQPIAMLKLLVEKEESMIEGINCIFNFKSIQK